MDTAHDGSIHTRGRLSYIGCGTKLAARNWGKMDQSSLLTFHAFLADEWNIITVCGRVRHGAGCRENNTWPNISHRPIILYSSLLSFSIPSSFIIPFYFYLFFCTFFLSFSLPSLLSPLQTPVLHLFCFLFFNKQLANRSAVRSNAWILAAWILWSLVQVPLKVWLFVLITLMLSCPVGVEGVRRGWSPTCGYTDRNIIK
jgi:hypothetical protein